MYQATTALEKINKLSKRIRFIPGGSSASKTISILLYLIAYAQTDKQITLTSIVAESIPHLKRGAMRDFKNIMQTHNYWRDDLWNATDSVYTFETGSQIEFFSTDSGDKLRGARRDRLFINEANNVTFEAFEQLEMRTKEFIICDWNPTNSFWAYEELQNRSDIEWLTLTYLDNEAIDPRIKASIESRKDRKGWWSVYGEGKLGELENKVYKGWTIIDELPTDCKLFRRGLDFGYTNDPTAIVDVYKHNGGFIFDEVCYQTGMSNKMIADLLKQQDNSVITYADSAEPKSIDEIKSFGVSIVPAQKGAGSVNQGIQFVQDQIVYVTKRSANLIHEYRNYLWSTDRNGKIMNIPEDMNNHCLDAIRYSFTGFYNQPIIKKINQDYTPMTSYGG